MTEPMFPSQRRPLTNVASFELETRPDGDGSEVACFVVDFFLTEEHAVYIGSFAGDRMPITRTANIEGEEDPLRARVTDRGRVRYFSIRSDRPLRIEIRPLVGGDIDLEREAKRVHITVPNVLPTPIGTIRPGNDTNPSAPT